MFEFSQLQSITFANNQLGDYLFSFFVFLLSIIIFKISQSLIIRRLQSLAQKTATDIDDTIITIVQSIKPPFYYLLSFYISLNLLNTKLIFNQITFGFLIIWAVFQSVEIASIFIDYLAQKYSKTKDQDAGTQSAIAALKLIVKIIIWALGFLLVLSNLGFDITSLIAGLGIGGVAIALAVQNILGDLLSSFSIYFDKPFQIGDFIIVDQNVMGTVQKIGIKTTRIQALQGEEIVVPNQTLTSSNIQNFKKLQKRRVVFNIGVTYQTPNQKLNLIPQIINDIISTLDETEFDRAHLKELGASALVFEVVYYAKTDDYNKHMDLQQSINLQILKQFSQQNIELAYPTQTLYINKD